MTGKVIGCRGCEVFVRDFEIWDVPTGFQDLWRRIESVSDGRDTLMLV